MAIPKIIFQTGWADKSLWNEKWLICEKSWKVHFPTSEYKYVFFDDEDIMDFVRDEFPEYLAFFISIEAKIYRADLIRYLFLYKYGGIYADLDYEAISNFYKELKPDFAYIVESPHPQYEIAQNSLMISNPQNEFWPRVIDEAVRRNCRRFYKNTLDILYTTGPVLLSDVYERNKNLKVELLPQKDFNPILLGADGIAFSRARFARHHCSSVYSPSSHTRQRQIASLLKGGEANAMFAHYVNKDMMSIAEIKDDIIS